MISTRETVSFRFVRACDLVAQWHSLPKEGASLFLFASPSCPSPFPPPQPSHPTSVGLIGESNKRCECGKNENKHNETESCATPRPTRPRDLCLFSSTAGRAKMTSGDLPKVPLRSVTFSKKLGRAPRDLWPIFMHNVPTVPPVNTARRPSVRTYLCVYEWPLKAI